jgi:hypothetical protein
MELSQGGLAAIVKAMNEHATYRLQLYFRDTPYDFDKVEFQLLDSRTIQRRSNTNRRMRVFEMEEANAMESSSSTGHELKRRNLRDSSDSQPSNHYSMNHRQIQERMYGTSLLLAGKVKFSSFPSAPSEECNAQLFGEMKRDWFMNEFIKEQNHPELVNVKQWLISATKDTAQPTIPPTEHPSSSPSSTIKPSSSPISGPTSHPSLIPTGKPSSSPSHDPTMQPVIAPSSHPSISASPSQLYRPSSKPSIRGLDVAGAGNEDEREVTNNGMNNSYIPIVIASALVSLVVFVGSGMFLKKVRKDRAAGGGGSKDSGHRRLKNDDEMPFSIEDPFEATIPTLLPTNEESSDSDDAQDYFSEPSGIVSSPTNPSVSSSSVKTAKMNNVTDTEITGDAEKKWVQSNTPMKISTKPPMPPLSTQRSAIHSGDVHDDLSPENINLGVVGAASAAVASGVSVGPSLMKFFVRGEGKSHSRNSSVTSSPGRNTPGRNTPSRAMSPITTITPSKVSKEEFEEGWDVDHEFNAFDNADGSFPKFDETNVRSANSKTSVGVRSNGDSTYYQSASEMHPLDWSNKGSEYDGASSIGESTFTDGENTATRELNQVSWDQVNRRNSSGGRTPLGLNQSELNTTNFMTPMTNDNARTPKSTFTALSQHSIYTSDTNNDSSPSSKGSSKQLINDLVWLEKKIADVRKRVDRLDGEEGSSSSSPPMSPDTDQSLSIGSPISHSIVCRDIVAPPGKLNIIIHSTKDGPAIHSVKTGSALEGKLFTGDLVVAVDDIDTRTFSSEEVMGMMSQKFDGERKMTVIHFDNYEDMV